MRGLTIRLLLVSLFMTTAPAFSASQEIVDGIAARVENDVILLSDIRALSRYQQFLDGKSETDSEILDRLIDQWVVRTEADVSLFPHPYETEIERELERLRKSFASEEQYETRRKQSGLSEAEVRSIVASQLYLSNYLDSRFRPSVQVDSKAIEDFYASTILPQAKARGQEPPTLDAAHDFIQEALVQRGINEQAEKWLKESRARLHVEILLAGGSK
ncbi:MAG TPA: hypothetical protein VEW05_16205 [Candidatus Polarisedimenticolia bacterium]|nr:hypothetical protein [Candidatus Polarisedimenticolia bacterium]